MRNKTLNYKLTFLSFSYFLLSIIYLISNTTVDRDLSRFSANIIFLNSLHIAITFYIFFNNKEVAIWRNSININKVISIESRFLLVVLFFIALLVTQNFIQEGYSKALSYCLLTYAVRHLIKQTLGLSLIQNYQKYKGRVLQNINAIEKKFTTILFILNAIFLFVKFNLINIDYYISKKTINEILALLMLVFIFCYIISLSYYLKKNLFIKSHFFFTYALYPISIYSDFATTGILAIHGVEYLLISMPFILSQKKSSMKGLFIVCFIILLCVFNELFNLRLIDLKYQQLLVALGVIQYTHYWMDSKIYKMKDEASLRHILPKVNSTIV